MDGKGSTARRVDDVALIQVRGETVEVGPLASSPMNLGDEEMVCSKTVVSRRSRISAPDNLVLVQCVRGSALFHHRNWA